MCSPLQVKTAFDFGSQTDPEASGDPNKPRKTDMLMERASGVLLHPTSIPTRFGIGDLGPQAWEFLDWLAGAGQRYWQVLPLCPADVGGSPYQSASSFAGNPLLISPELLARDGLLTDGDLQEAALPDIESALRVDFSLVTERKMRLLERAVENLHSQSGHSHWREQLHHFVAQHRHWVEAHALFMAARESNQLQPWQKWSQFRDLKPPFIPRDLAPRFMVHLVFQFLFYRQWQEIRDRACQLGIRIIGDIPIYVSYDSAAVWASRHLFQLDADGNSTRVAGVPPDYFAATGQLWNNPLYDWNAMESEGYAWWIRRLKASLDLVDEVRLDHFRGFEAYWSVPAGELTAMNGEWVPGPRAKLLQAFADALRPADSPTMSPSVPIIAEDLGMITEEVHALRKQFQLPGMKVLQFMLPGEPWDQTRAEDFEPNSVVYTGTHDNDTSLGWFREKMLPDHGLLERLRRYVPCHEDQFPWEFIDYAWRSGSNLAIAPLQDLLSLDSSARMNTPGTSGDATTNWRWKYSPGMLTPETQRRLADLTRSAQRG
jgi:4-alpha-glucanotransferase